MSPIRGHLLLLGITATLCIGAFVLDLLYYRQGHKGEEVAKALDVDWWHDGRASLGLKWMGFSSIGCAATCVLFLVFDIVFPAAWVVHIWFELLLLVVCALDMIAAGVYVGLTDLQFLFRGLSHEQTFCLLAIIGIMLGYVGALCVLATSVFVWRVPRRIVQSSDGKRYWRRSIRQIYHNRYTGLPPDVIFADLDGTVKHDGKRGSTGADSWYQESAYALNTQQRTSWIPPAQGSATAPAVPPNPYSTPYDR